MFHAELAAREAGNLTLAEALELVVLYAEAEPAKFEKAAVRWHVSSPSRRDSPASEKSANGTADRGKTLS